MKEINGKEYLTPIPTDKSKHKLKSTKNYEAN